MIDYNGFPRGDVAATVHLAMLSCHKHPHLEPKLGLDDIAKVIFWGDHTNGLGICAESDSFLVAELHNSHAIAEYSRHGLAIAEHSPAKAKIAVFRESGDTTGHG